MSKVKTVDWKPGNVIVAVTDVREDGAANACFLLSASEIEDGILQADAPHSGTLGSRLREAVARAQASAPWMMEAVRNSPGFAEKVDREFAVLELARRLAAVESAADLPGGEAQRLARIQVILTEWLGLKP